MREVLAPPGRHGESCFIEAGIFRRLLSDHKINEAARAMHAHGLPSIVTAKTDKTAQLITAGRLDWHADTQNILPRITEIVSVLFQLGQQLQRKILCLNPVSEIAVLTENIGTGRGRIRRRGDGFAFF